MIRCLTAVALVLGAAALAPLVHADDAKAQKPLGAWERKTDQGTITFQIQADKLHCTIKLGNGTIEVDADYGVTRDGRLYGVVTKAEHPGGDGPAVGDPFSFRFSAAKDKLTVSELRGSNGDGKQLLEGEYRKVEAK